MGNAGTESGYDPRPGGTILLHQQDGLGLTDRACASTEKTPPFWC